MKKEIIIAFDISTKNTGITIYNNGIYDFEEFHSLRMPILQNGKISKSKSKGVFDIKIFFKELMKIKSKYKDYRITIIYATFVTNTNFSTNGTLYKLVGILELVFGKENIVERLESTARKTSGINTKVSKRVKESVEEQGFNVRSEEGKKIAAKLRRKYYKEEAIKLLEKEQRIIKSDDIADSYIIMKDYLKELEENEELPI